MNCSNFEEEKPESVNPCYTYVLGAKVYNPCSGYEVLKKKNIQNKATQIKSSHLILCLRKNQGRLDDEQCRKERSNCTTLFLGQVLNLWFIKQSYRVVCRN